MMKTLAILLLIVPFAGTAQSGFLFNDPFYVMDNSYNFDYNFSSKSNLAIYKEAHVKAYKVISNKKDGTSEVSVEREFNSDGNVIFEKNKYFTKKRKFNGLLLTDVIKTSKKKTWENHAEYDDQGRVTRVTKKYNGKLQKEYKYEYYEGNKRSLTQEINYSGKVSVSSYVTNYDPLLKTPTESNYYRNGELKTHWTYTCDSKGEVPDKKAKVEDVNSCHYNATNNDGSYIEYARTIREEKVYLTESYYTKDSVMTEQKIYFNEKQLIYHLVINDQTTVTESFTRKGKRINKTRLVRDANGNVVSYRSFSKKDKERYGYDCRYNTQNLSVHVEYLGQKGSIDFEYVFF